MRRTRSVILCTPSPLESRLPRASKPAQHTWYAPLISCVAAAAAAVATAAAAVVAAAVAAAVAAR